MARFHFVEDYERYVARLMKRHPLDEAMSLAVGGGYETIGAIEYEILRHAGLARGDRVVDFGCGSGRLAVALARNLEVAYHGIDVVDALLAYARRKCPPHYVFTRNRVLTLPVATGSADLICAFSVFTHLLQTETYLYLEDMARCLRPGGTLVCSFLELAAANAWNAFLETVEQQRISMVPNLNMFLERNQIAGFASRLGYGPVEFIDADAAPWASGQALGQSVAILRKP